MSTNQIKQSNLELAELNVDDLNGVVGGCQEYSETKKDTYQCKPGYQCQSVYKSAYQDSMSSMLPSNEQADN